MIIVNLKGGLGNQMFQYALGKHIAIKTNTDLRLDLRYLSGNKKSKFVTNRNYELDIFKLESKKINNVNLAKYKIVNEQHFHFSQDVLNTPDNTIIDGYWQSEKYFKEIENIIKTDFQFKDELTGKHLNYAYKIANSNSVCLHVRRGYLNNFRERLIHGFLGMKYIESAIDLIKTKVENPEFFVFSDNPDWCEKNIRADLPLHFVEKELKTENNKVYFQLMTLGKYFIISNSTFSWWGAWLADNKDKIVIAPKKWFRFSLNNTKDICPNDWIRI